MVKNHPVERIIQYDFKDHALLEEALSAAGASLSVPMNDIERQGNKRLALVGDALLRLVIVDDGIVAGKTTAKCQDICVGDISNTALQKLQEKCHLTPYIQTSPAQKGTVTVTTGATTVEALVGAVWLDSCQDYACVHRVVHNLGIGHELLKDDEHSYGSVDGVRDR
ncbi:ribonuclease III domain-containing protein [Dactylonectria macrodidyma]|uniref:Ribonuclease III domain-containing protein n=1 Tax=Dactylonectria macrodidyma TaxID=307937 RepID=A0A9P9DEG2_9HYPO|nr:ribonuclease III domain-containing protein [Dactylonectria macrodidyma]